MSIAILVTSINDLCNDYGTLITITSTSTAQVGWRKLPNDPDTGTCSLHIPGLLDDGVGAAGGAHCVPQLRC